MRTHTYTRADTHCTRPHTHVCTQLQPSPSSAGGQMMRLLRGAMICKECDLCPPLFLAPLLTLILCLTPRSLRGD